MLKAEHISTGYGKKQVLFDVSLEVKQGEILLLIGSNGSGKSTLLKALYGLLPLWTSPPAPLQKERGAVWFNGENITGLPTAQLLKKGLLYIPQKNNLFEDLTVKENLEMAGLTINNKKLLQQRIDKVLEMFPSLAPNLKRTLMKQSGGERKLLALAMAMLHEPKMVMIDEPFAGLSLENIVFVREKLKVLNEKEDVGFLIVEHRIKESYKIAKKIIGLKLGRAINIQKGQPVDSINKLDKLFI